MNTDRVSARLYLAIVFAILSGACSRYEYMNELDVPGLCPTEEELRIARERAPALQYEPLAPGSADSLRGRVVESDTSGRELTHRAVRMAQVQLLGSGHSVQTDSTGRFVVHVPSSGRFLLRVQYLGYVPRVDTLHLPLANTAGVLIGLRTVYLDGPCSGFAAVRVKKPWWKW